MMKHLVFIAILSLNLNFSFQVCDIKSQITSVENVVGDKTYDLILSITTKESENCKVVCDLVNVESSQIEVQLAETYSFTRRIYNIYKIKNLSQYVTYKYACQSLEYNLSVNREVFKFSFPKRSSFTKVAAFGDWSECADGNKTLKYLSERVEEYDSTIVLGDLAYDLFTNDGRVGNDFMNFISTITTKIPFMSTSGNHEAPLYYKDFIERFQMPLKKSYNNLYYSFDINSVHFTSIPSDFFVTNAKLKNQAPGETEVDKLLNWLKEDLKNSNKRWKVVFFHRPPYCSDLTKPVCMVEAEILRQNLEDIFYEFKVDIILNGHVHLYERLYPIYKGKVDQDAISQDRNVYNNPKYPVYLICGAAGNTNGLHKYYKPAEYSHVVIARASVCELTFDENSIKVENFSVEDKSLLDKYVINKVARNEMKSLRVLNEEGEKIQDNANATENVNANTTVANNEENKNAATEKNETVNSNDGIVDNKTEATNTTTTKTNISQTGTEVSPTPEIPETLKEEKPSLEKSPSPAETNEDSTDKETDEDTYDEYRQEDQMAKKAFYLTVVFLTIFITIFLYNLIKCYTRSPPVEKSDARGYSRELQVQTAIEDDAVLDLSTA